MPKPRLELPQGRDPPCLQEPGTKPPWAALPWRTRSSSIPHPRPRVGAPCPASTGRAPPGHGGAPGRPPSSKPHRGRRARQAPQDRGPGCREGEYRARLGGHTARPRRSPPHPRQRSGVERGLDSRPPHPTPPEGETQSQARRSPGPPPRCRRALPPPATASARKARKKGKAPEPPRQPPPQPEDGRRGKRRQSRFPGTAHSPGEQPYLGGAALRCAARSPPGPCPQWAAAAPPSPARPRPAR
ncbi:basic proline-rich protein-like [Pezoporus flaviventris]|uniref:basic proline-rich protein-like n=1 Tax=Pezoporus flaviventris TaxID=889875 RepID=UPI002AB17508|nr:basic proline-rich protein-like [Pezoporus flaviventris]